MVTCRCGAEFENSRWDSHVICPKCKRIYPNSSPNMFHPKAVDELKWNCLKCGASNDCSYAASPRRNCAKCGANRPGNPEDWYEI